MQSYTLSQKIEILKKSGNLLSYKTFPKCKIGEDIDISILKTTDLVFDGYTCGVYYSVSIFENYIIRNLQIWPKYHSFLPQDTVFGLAEKFLGKFGLCFFEVWNNDKVIYIFVLVLNENNEIIRDFYKSDKKEEIFNDIIYTHIDNPEINII